MNYRSCLLRFLVSFLAVMLTACQSTPARITTSVAPDPQAMVLMGPDGAAVVRIVTSAPQCPVLSIDGMAHETAMRAPAQTIALRPTRSAPSDSKPSAFLVSTCELLLPANARDVRLADQVLPLPKTQVNRIVVIGDTGCRLKISDNAFQPCNDPNRYPFATVAERAAAWHPDLVIHVGDYLYRENACPSGDAACAGSPWGYGFDAWQADFFAPAAPLLKAAPWVAVRGNHESCNRAGQGWWRFMDPRPLLPGRDCNRALDDDNGDYSDAFNVPIGADTQLLVMDTSNTPAHPLAHDDIRSEKYRALYRQIQALAQKSTYNIGVNHQPILAFAASEEAGGAIKLWPGNLGLQSAFAELDPHVLPSGIQLMLSGHIHLWEQISYKDTYPSQFVAGFSGTMEDIVPLPASPPPAATPIAGGVVDAMSSWIDGFGYMTMERKGPGQWAVTIWNLDGAVVNTCAIDGRVSRCALSRAH